VIRAMAYATRDRKVKKREFRTLWIIRLNAAARTHGLTYGQMMAAFKRAKILLNRQQLAELALHDAEAFRRLLETAKAGPAGHAPPRRGRARQASATASQGA